MEITFIKEQTSQEFIKEMEKKYGSIERLKTHMQKTNDPLDNVDLHAWEYFLENPDETIKKTHTKLTNEIKFLELDFDLLEAIKEKNPESIKELAKLTNENIKTITHKIDHLNKTGLIEFKENNVPILNYDKIEIAI